MRRMIVLALIAAAFAATLVFWPQLPERVPIHFNMDGDVDGWTTKGVGLFLNPLLMLAIFALFEVLPHASPRGYEISANTRAYAAIELVTIAFMLAVQGFILATALGRRVPVGALAPFAVGVLLVVIGNYLGKVSRNFFVGIRTPWTLANEDVWYRTHRLGGRLFVIAGLLVMIAAPFGGRAAVVMMLTVVGAVAAITIAYSWIIYRRLDAAARQE